MNLCTRDNLVCGNPEWMDLVQEVAPVVVAEITAVTVVEIIVVIPASIEECRTAGKSQKIMDTNQI